MKHRQSAKLLAATIGGGAFVVMGAITAMVGDTPASNTTIVSGPMTQGATVTEVAATTTLPGSVLPTPKAKPAVKATAYH
jgi:hypothetical protein